jgi:hypothetical protein
LPLARLARRKGSMAEVNAIIEKFGTSRKAISCGSLLGFDPNMGGGTTL